MDKSNSRRRRRSPQASHALSACQWILAAIAVSACGASEPSDRPEHDLKVASQLAVSDAQRYIDSLYTQNDVRYSFLTKAGEDIDCIDFFAQPAAKAMAARGVSVSIPSIPPPPPGYTYGTVPTTGPLADMWFNGQPDVNGHPRRCPEGTVPQVRLTVQGIQAAGGLGAFLSAAGHKGTPSVGQSPPPALSLGVFVHELFDYANTGQTRGGSGSVSVFNPANAIPVTSGGPVEGHSIVQSWTTGAMTNGTNSRGQTVEVGWNIDPHLYGNDTQTHLFIDATVDGYQTTGCYNNIQLAPPGRLCVPFFLLNGVTAPGQQFILNPGSIGGAQSEIILLTYNYNGTQSQPKNWWIFIGIPGVFLSPVGFYVVTGCTQNCYSGNMTAVADEYMIGGEVGTKVGGSLSGFLMGSGLCGETGFAHASYVHDSGWFDSSNPSVFHSPQQFQGFPIFSELGGPSPPDFPYDWNVSQAPGFGNWKNWFYLGGPGASTPTCFQRPRSNP